MGEYKYKLTLEVEEHGAKRSFATSGEWKDELGFRDMLCDDIVRAVRSTMQQPLESMDFVEWLEDPESVFFGLAHVYSHWNGRGKLTDCIEVVVDWAKLEPEPSNMRATATSKRVAERCGIKIKGEESPFDFDGSLPDGTVPMATPYEVEPNPPAVGPGILDDDGFDNI